MVKQTEIALSDAAEWLGDWHPLAEQLGSADGLATLGSVSSFLNIGPVFNVPSLRNLLRNYQSQILFPFEFPAIRSAHGHASLNELRELIALDQQLAGEPVLQSFASASGRVGQSQLQKLPTRLPHSGQKIRRAVQLNFSASTCGSRKTDGEV